MPTAFYSALETGFIAALAQLGRDVVCGAVTKKGIRSDLTENFELQETGYLGQADCTIEVFRSDLVAMGVTNRSVLTTEGKTFSVLGFLGDAEVDPCVRIVCKLEP